MPYKAQRFKPFSQPMARHVVSNKSERAMSYRSAEWQAIRKWVIARDEGLCQECKRNNRIKPGNQVDHIDGNALNNAIDGSNWQLLCHAHHSAKTAREDGGFGNKRRG